MNRPQLTADDYTAADLDQVRALMNTAAAEWERLLKAHTVDGQWKPADADPLDQLVEADALLAGMSRAVVEARAGIRAIDAVARRRFLDRSAPHAPS